MHIDVYCTGSDAEGDDSSDDSSSSSASHSKDHLKEDDSTATPQTVYDNSKYRLHHKRIDNCKNLPRRMGGQSTDMHNTPSAMPHSGSPITPYNLREFLLSKSDTKDEVNESKQMLFNKHIGLTSDYQVRPNQRFNTRNRFRKDNSDGCLSSNYPNSSRSTVRDFTSSSISSALASNSAIYDDLEYPGRKQMPMPALRPQKVLNTIINEIVNEFERWTNDGDEINIQPRLTMSGNGIKTLFLIL